MGLIVPDNRNFLSPVCQCIFAYLFLLAESFLTKESSLSRAQGVWNFYRTVVKTAGFSSMFPGPGEAILRHTWVCTVTRLPFASQGPSLFKWNARYRVLFLFFFSHHFERKIFPRIVQRRVLPIVEVGMFLFVEIIAKYKGCFNVFVRNIGIHCYVIFMDRFGV